MSEETIINDLRAAIPTTHTGTEADQPSREGLLDALEDMASQVIENKGKISSGPWTPEITNKGVMFGDGRVLKHIPNGFIDPEGMAPMNAIIPRSGLTLIIPNFQGPM